jgi:multiple sugar transport system ATP-binding protein
MVLGFRPEAFLPAEQIPEPERARTFRFLIERIEYLGSYNLAYGRVGDTPVIANVSRQLLEEGREQIFAVRAEDLRRYDPASGRRVMP